MNTVSLSEWKKDQASDPLFDDRLVYAVNDRVSEGDLFFSLGMALVTGALADQNPFFRKDIVQAESYLTRAAEADPAKIAYLARLYLSDYFNEIHGQRKAHLLALEWLKKGLNLGQIDHPSIDCAYLITLYYSLGPLKHSGKDGEPYYTGEYWDRSKFLDFLKTGLEKGSTVCEYIDAIFQFFGVTQNRRSDLAWQRLIALRNKPDCHPRARVGARQSTDSFALYGTNIPQNPTMVAEYAKREKLSFDEAIAALMAKPQPYRFLFRYSIQKFEEEFEVQRIPCRSKDLDKGKTSLYTDYYNNEAALLHNKLDEDQKALTEPKLAAIFARADELSANAVMGTPSKASGYQKKIRSNVGFEPDVVEWLKGKHPKHFSHVNSILKALMEAELQQSPDNP